VGGIGGKDGRPSAAALALAACSSAESNHDPVGGGLSSFAVALDVESGAFMTGMVLCEALEGVGGALAHVPLPCATYRFPVDWLRKKLSTSVEILAFARDSSLGEVLLAPTNCNPEPPGLGGGPLGPEEIGGAGDLPCKREGGVGFGMTGGARVGLATFAGTASAHGPLGSATKLPSRPMEPTVLFPPLCRTLPEDPARRDASPTVMLGGGA